MPSRAATAPVPAPTPSTALRNAVLGLTVLALFAMFTGESGDADTWIHLRTGQWMVENHKLPIPDPFAWTTYLGKPVYPAEYATRDLNLKHEWLGQVVWYLVWAAGGAPGMILFRAACVAGFCLIIGWVVWRRTANFYLSIGAIFAASTLARSIAVDRPYVVTYLLLALTVLILERRRPLWVLPPIFLFWANFHGGFFVGWIVLGAYCGEALVERLRGKAPADERTLWAASIASLLASALNPAVYGVIPGMLAYRQSFMQNTLAEWHSPAMWPPSWHSGLLLGGAAVLIAAWKRVRVADWLMFGIFAAMAYMAFRNVIFLALVSPIVIATYLPKWKFAFPRAAEYAVAAAILLIAGERVASGRAFQLHVASWKFPDGAVRFLRDHNITGPMFNLYEWGGYLMWSAWPTQKTFVDGRALNESVFRDYMRIALNSRDLAHFSPGSRDGQELLDRYGVQVILVEGFEYSRGTVYFLAPALAIDPASPWKLVYQDNAAMVFLRNPPPGVQALPSTDVFTSLEAQCRNQIDHAPGMVRCARGLGDLYARLNALDRSRLWLEAYLARNTEPDPPIDQLYNQIRSGTYHAPALR
jgi:hypothetical protein